MSTTIIVGQHAFTNSVSKKKRLRKVYFETWHGDGAIFTTDREDAKTYATSTSNDLVADIDALRVNYPAYNLKTELL